MPGFFAPKHWSKRLGGRVSRELLLTACETFHSALQFRSATPSLCDIAYTLKSRRHQRPAGRYDNWRNSYRASRDGSRRPALSLVDPAAGRVALCDTPRTTDFRKHHASRD